MIAARYAANALLLLHGAAAGAEPECAQIERGLDARVAAMPSVADELGALRGIGRASLEGLKTCPDSARLWYLAARSAEVLEAATGEADFGEYGGAKRLAVEANAHAPESAPIATILARLDGAESSARRAYELDPDYAPARRALALGSANHGKIEEALALLARGDENSDYAVRARIHLKAGRLRKAEAQARLALAHAAFASAEPGPASQVWSEANEVLGLALAREGRTKEALRPLRAAASQGSRAAREELAKIRH